ncbi:gamma-glutamylcyclotransferase family protein [Nocardia sp. NPDC020380]|uniref:gamma-glutamylcyclotransferase family protein n=1 Tax=Nocardia sp. NPDC020380 TaxID=3364309 RepID=UPI0037A73EB9
MNRGWARRLPEPEQPLFVYGTLRFPGVVTELIGRAPASEPARLPGHRTAALPGRVYPGLVTAAGAVAHGFLLTGLSSADWRVLDAFEDDEYFLKPVSVHAGECETYAWTYAWTAEVTHDDWSADAFAAEQLPRYLRKCAAWRNDLILLNETV